MTARTYTSPQSFKQALEQRLRITAGDGTSLVRSRQLLVFDRFLARVVAVLGDAVLLKGGLVLELRLERARTTKDIDLRVVGSPETVLTKLQEAGRRDLGDFMMFEVIPAADQPTIQNDGMQYEGLRFRAECRLAGKLYGQRFGVDVAFGDPILGEPATVTADDILEFAGIVPPVLQLYPIETHIAEKLHAYTMPRVRPNTRVKDLPDIALLATAGSLESATLRAALESTFTFRATHPLPSSLPDPPANWLTPYVEMARENGLSWATLDQVTTAVGTFLNPVLAGAGGVWLPAAWAWDSST
ncbi:MAG TPA: nucleotidyl transferase AbiEii/AbiGii toxin family protein [Steroidobacteraceae bacterium]